MAFFLLKVALAYNIWYNLCVIERDVITMFIDEVNLKLIAGKGGDGCTSFLREKYVPLGGPDGGNGGKGGSIIFKADKGLRTLIDLRYKKIIKGNNGEIGLSFYRSLRWIHDEKRVVFPSFGKSLEVDGRGSCK